MTLRTYLIIMSLATIISFLAWLTVVFMVNPEITNWVGFALFYFSLFLFLLGGASLLGFFVRFVALKRELAFRLVKSAFRQSFLFSLLVVISLFLCAHNLFTWLNLFFLIFGLSVLEFFLLGYDKSRLG